MEVIHEDEYLWVCSHTRTGTPDSCRRLPTDEERMCHTQSRHTLKWTKERSNAYVSFLLLFLCVLKVEWLFFLFATKNIFYKAGKQSLGLHLFFFYTKSFYFLVDWMSFFLFVSEILFFLMTRANLTHTHTHTYRGDPLLAGPNWLRFFFSFPHSVSLHIASCVSTGECVCNLSVAVADVLWFTEFGLHAVVVSQPLRCEAATVLVFLFTHVSPSLQLVLLAFTTVFFVITMAIISDFFKSSLNVYYLYIYIYMFMVFIYLFSALTALNPRSVSLTSYFCLFV